MKKKNQNVNAAILIIGNEILSGSTQDKNISFISNWLNDNVEYNQDDVFIISQPYSRYWNLYLDRMGSHVEIDEHSYWGDVTTGQVIEIIDEQPFKVIHVRGHKLSLWEYDSLTLVISPDYELVQSIDFIEGKIDVYHRLKDGGLA